MKNFKGKYSWMRGTAALFCAAVLLAALAPAPVRAVFRVTLSYGINSGNGTAPSSEIHDAGDTVTVAAQPTDMEKPGYDFSGWNTAADGSGTDYKSGDDIIINEDTTLYAKWTEQPDVAIVYLSADETMGSVSSAGESVPPATGSAVGSTAQAKEGWRFVSWIGKTAAVVSTEAAFIPAKTDELYTAGTYIANFAPNSYTVTLDPQGGTVQKTTQAVVFNEAYGELPVPVREGFAFGGWYTETAGGTQTKDDTLYTTAGNSTLYARWTADTAPAETTPAETTSAATTSAVTASAGTTSPKTGDALNSVPWIVLLAVSGSAAAVIGKKRRESN